MNLRFTCPYCGQNLTAPADKASSSVCCLNCRKLIQAPTATSLAQNSAPSQPASAACEMLSAQRQDTSGLAIASFVFGVLSILGGALCCGAPIPVLAIVLGHIAHYQIVRQPNILTGKNLAIAGFVLGYASIVIWFIISLLVLMLPAILD